MTLDPSVSPPGYRATYVVGSGEIAGNPVLIARTITARMQGVLE